MFNISLTERRFLVRDIYGRDRLSAHQRWFRYVYVTYQIPLLGIVDVQMTETFNASERYTAARTSV